VPDPRDRDGTVSSGLEGRTICVLSSLFAGVYYGALITSVARAASRAGGRTVAIQTQSANWPTPGRRDPTDTGRVGWDRIDGFAVITDAVPRHFLERVRAAGKPLVLISRPEPGLDCPVVLPDNRSGVTAAIEHMLGHGHTRIAFAGDIGQHDINERYEAYKQTLRARGVEPVPALFFPTTGNHVEAGRQVATEMMAAGLPSTAVFAATDYNAIGIMEVLKEAGYSLPHDQAIVGFDDMPETDLVSPALSTVRQNFHSVGTRAVELLAQQFNTHEEVAGEYLVRTSFLARQSCGCATSLAAPTLQHAAADPVDAFVDDVVNTLRRSSPLVAGGDVTLFGNQRACGTDSNAPIADVGRQIAAKFLTAMQRPLETLELLKLEQLSERLYHRDFGLSAFSVMSLAHRLARRLESDAGGTDEDRSNRLESCIQQVGIGIAKAGVIEQMRVNQVFQESVRSEYDLSMELLRGHEKDPRSLEWMAKTAARTGILALWIGGTAKAQLDVVGSYDWRGAKVTLSEKRFWPENFPPAELLDVLTQEPDSLMLLLPVRTSACEWGFWALVTKMDATFISQDTYFQCAALLGQALDYEAVTASLRQRNQDLAYSYRRERELAATIKQSEERYALAARAANDGLWDWDLAAGTIYYSTRWREMLGFADDAIGNTPEEWLDRVHPEDKPALLAALGQPSRGSLGPFENEHRILSADGAYQWVLCRGLGVSPDGGPVNRLVGSLSDIMARRSLEEQLLQQALYDSLTGLPNRALFLDRLSQSIAQTRRSRGHNYAVLWLDLDGFKVVNDSLGHLVGDELLKRVATRVSRHLRHEDTAARFGGDEFAVLLQHLSDFSDVQHVVTRLQEDLGRPYDLDGQEVVVTASIGIATSAHKYVLAEDVLRDADIAMYQAKANGRAGFAIFDASMHAVALSRLQTETDLRQAIDQGQLELYYQPIVELAEGRLRAIEVLVRWGSPVRGLVPPAEFLPIAEESGLILALGQWVQHETCRQLVEWKRAGLVPPELRASINLSNREFWNPGLLEQVEDILASTGAPAEWLSFEITEGVIMHNLERGLEVLDGLHARGVQIHIDDFGTGYSSLEALHRLPIDALKIDRTFVANLQEGKSTEVVRTIIQLGRNLGVDVIAEGIETPMQQHILAELGCPLGQGYWFSRSVPALRLGELLSASTSLPGHLPAGRPELDNGGLPGFMGASTARRDKTLRRATAGNVKAALLLDRASSPEAPSPR
jgi:diguanylate cyclase (GGDEF)-like protein/PAS domain S-box-containing protein